MGGDEGLWRGTATAPLRSTQMRATPQQLVRNKILLLSHIFLSSCLHGKSEGNIQQRLGCFRQIPCRQELESALFGCHGIIGPAQPLLLSLAASSTYASALLTVQVAFHSSLHLLRTCDLASRAAHTSGLHACNKAACKHGPRHQGCGWCVYKWLDGAAGGGQWARSRCYAKNAQAATSQHAHAHMSTPLEQKHVGEAAGTKDRPEKGGADR
jgi:hypothetical protein